MKIEDNSKIIPFADSQTKKTNPTTSSKSFGQILEETTERKSPQSAKMTGSLPLSPLVPFNQSMPEKGIDKLSIVSKLEKMLDVLDQYRSHLNNPQISLRQMAPVTQDLADKLEELAPEVEKLDANDSLLPILNEALLTASLEMKKFESGWYNP